FSCVAWPQTVYRFQNQVSSPKILYCRDEYGIILEQAFGELQMGRITKVPDADPEELLMKSILEEAEDEPLWNRNALRLLFLDSNTGRHYPYAKSVLFIESEDGKQREFCFFYEDGILKAADSEGKEFNYSRERIFG
ncbi:MAG: hypothetical protein LIO80_05890, partial [Lachnospiraceae bacterium]|nr:hypothetical protein [Lachnospiraceae bacterium]